MDYIAHTVTAAAEGSVARILWAAADLAATNPETVDPIHDAGLHIIAAGQTTARRGTAAIELATMVAADCHPGWPPRSGPTTTGPPGSRYSPSPGPSSPTPQASPPGSPASKPTSPRDAGPSDRAAVGVATTAAPARGLCRPRLLDYWTTRPVGPRPNDRSAERLRRTHLNWGCFADPHQSLTSGRRGDKGREKLARPTGYRPAARASFGVVNTVAPASRLATRWQVSRKAPARRGRHRREAPTQARTATTSREDRAAAHRELAAQLHVTITDTVAALTDTAEWAAFLDYATTFHAYSLNNLMFILAQRPDASQIAGCNKWLELGRHVRKGEKVIWISKARRRGLADLDLAW